MAWYDIVITILILGGLTLAIWAAVSKQTIMELIRDIFEFIRERKESIEPERYLD